MNTNSVVHHAEEFIREIKKHPEQMTLGDRVRMVRMERGLTVTQLAKLANTYRTNLCSIESNRRGMTVWTFIEIARALHVSLDYLAGLSDQP